jgi:hypothetical protein
MNNNKSGPGKSRKPMRLRAPYRLLAVSLPDGQEQAGPKEEREG